MKLVMLIDDEEDIRVLLGKQVRRISPLLQVELFENAAKALIYLDENKHLIDLIITDVKMPGMSGLQMIEKLRNEGFQKPIIAITGAPDRDEQEVHLLLAETNFMLSVENRTRPTEIIPKPIDTVHLLKVIKDILRDAEFNI